VKRLLLAGALALMAHGLFFAWVPRLSTQRSIERPKPLTVTLSEPRAACTGVASKSDQPLPLAEAPAITPESHDTTAPPKEDILNKETARSPKEAVLSKSAMPGPRLSARTEEARLGRKPIAPLKKAPLKREISKKKEESTPSPSAEKSFPVEVASKSDATLAPAEIQGAALPPSEPIERRSLGSPSDAYGPTGGPSPPAGDGPTPVPQDEPVVRAVPAYRDNPRPEYPTMAKRRGYEGTVLLDVFVDHTGKALDVRLRKSSGYDVLDKSAITSVKQWLFEPGSIGGRKVDMWVRVPVRFELTQN